MPTSQPGGYWEFQVKDVHRVVDGDTFDLYIDLGFHQYGAYRFRLRGIDTPELYRPENDEELKAAREARDFVRHWLTTYLPQGVYIRSFEQGSFGRWVADVVTYAGEGDGVQHLSTALEDEGYHWPDA